jgi:ABC-type transporter lipoprotein component MlaA
MQDYADKYTAARDTYIDAAEALKLATGPYKASRDAYVAASKFMQAQRDESPAHYARPCVSFECRNEP